MTAPTTAPLERVRALVHIDGTVQGVGFRPHAYRLATALRLSGDVRNDPRGVAIDVEGDAIAIERFLERLRSEAPPLAVIERFTVDRVAPTGAHGFAIRPSEPPSTHDATTGADGFAIRPPSTHDALVAPDSATCEECLHECDDPADRRYRYPFVNCTACGPRFTIVTDVPYDRRATTMAAFAMCEDCRAEYEDPGDRRFHAQPIACPRCGPTLRLIDPDGAPAPLGGARDALEAAAQALQAGLIVAVKGIGGYQLACRADSQPAVTRLRARKHREDKPLAVMASDPGHAATLVHLTAADAALLRGRERAIVICARRSGAPVAEAVAPGHRTLGVMLPASALHHMLARDCATALVMTSGNLSDEPISHRDEDARTRLRDVADLLLVHDRPIHVRADDSVARTVRAGVGRRRLQMIRRARGYAPAPAELPIAAPRPILACGAELKSTLCLAKGRHAWVSQHIGDLRDYEALRCYRETARHLAALFALQPALVAHDLHPDYLSTAHAHEQEGVELLGVQHHHAHLAAVLAEHGLQGPAMGVIFDGSGFGSDGTSWGGELLVGDLRGFERAGSLNAVPLPGGDAAARQPWRMAAAWLHAAFDEAAPLPQRLAGRLEEERWANVNRLLAADLATPRSSSAGRLFDAVAALCGLAVDQGYEGQAATALEQAVARGERAAYPLETREEDGWLELDARPTVRALARDLAAGVAVPRVAARFHNALARAGADACAILRARSGLERVVLSGGVFQNAILLERTAALLQRDGFAVLTAERFPCNDGGISFGQAAIAAAQMRAEG
jgi:hydrogenase maturation protein HypF